MTPPGLDPEEGSQRFIPFLVGLLGFRFRAVTFKSEAACFLFKMYGCVNLCVCTYNPTSIDSLFLFSFCFQIWLWFHLLVVPEDLTVNRRGGKQLRRQHPRIQNLPQRQTSPALRYPSARVLRAIIKSHAWVIFLPSTRLISFFLGGRIASWTHDRWRGSRPAVTVRHSTLVV